MTLQTRIAPTAGVLVQQTNQAYPVFSTVSFAGSGGITISNQNGTAGSIISFGLNGSFSGASSGTNTGDQVVFKTIAVSGQSDVVADTTTDTLTLVAGSNVTITTNATTDTITINASSGSGSITDSYKVTSFRI